MGRRYNKYHNLSTVIGQAVGMCQQRYRRSGRWLYEGKGGELNLFTLPMGKKKQTETFYKKTLHTRLPWVFLTCGEALERSKPDFSGSVDSVPTAILK